MFTTKMRQSDAIPQSFNRYAYVGNDPVNFTDPSGLDSCFTPPNAGQAVCHPDPMIGVGNGNSMIGYQSPDMRAGESQHGLFTGNAMQGLGYGVPGRGSSSGISADVWIYGKSEADWLRRLDYLATFPYRIRDDGSTSRYYDMRGLEDQTGSIISDILIGKAVGTAFGVIRGAVGTLLGRVGAGATQKAAAPEVKAGADLISDYLGKGATRVPSPPGGSDIILRSADGTRWVRFDLTNPHGLAPHINMETFRPRNLFPGDRRWIQLGNEHIFPRP